MYSKLLVVAVAIASTLAVPTNLLNLQPTNNTIPHKLRWGKDGHIITAEVAQQLLTAHATTKVQQIIPEEEGLLSNVANWADEVKEQSGYFWSAPLHYINTPDWKCNFDHTRDCGDDVCVAGAISNYTERLRTESGDQQNEALKFLVHFVGDIHQPLHVGFTSDEGGNTIRIKYGSQSENLHKLWDSGLIYTLIDTDFGRSDAQLSQYLVSQIKTQWASLAASWVTCSQGSFPCPDEWAEESIEAACNNAYVNSDGTTHIQSGDVLGDDYYQHNKDVLVKQLAKSGVRMAAIINSILT